MTHRTRRAGRTLLLVALLSLGLGAAGPSTTAPDLAVIIETEPPAAAIIPDETLVETRLRVVDGAGQPLPAARVALRLVAPPPPALLHTDFPLVEGSTLLEVTEAAADGTLAFATIYPIRGRYTFHTEVTLPDGRTLSTAPTLDLHENPAERRNGLLLIAALGAFGLLSGLLLGWGQRRTLLVGGALLAGLVLPGATAAHGPGGTHSDAPLVVTEKAGLLHAELTITPGHGAVGELTALTVRLREPDGRPAEGAVTLGAWHSEDGRPVATLHLPTSGGEATARLQFFDGADHELRVRARSQDGHEIALATPLTVVTASPPLALKLHTLGLLLLPVAGGLGLGIWLGLRPALR